jgi:hypothetical protein
MFNVQPPAAQVSRPAVAPAPPRAGSSSRLQTVTVVRFACAGPDHERLHGVRATAASVPTPEQRRDIDSNVRMRAYLAVQRIRNGERADEFEGGYRHAYSREALPAFLTAETIEQLCERLIETSFSALEQGRIARRIDDIELEAERPRTDARIGQLKSDRMNWLMFCNGYAHARGISVPGFSPAGTELEARLLLRTGGLAPRHAGALFAKIEDMALVSQAERHFDHLSAWQQLFEAGQADAYHISIPGLPHNPTYEQCLRWTIEGGHSATQFGALHELAMMRWHAIEALASSMRIVCRYPVSRDYEERYAAGWRCSGEQNAPRVQMSIESLYMDWLLKRDEHPFEAGAIARQIAGCRPVTERWSRQARDVIALAAHNARATVESAARPPASANERLASPAMTDVELAELFLHGQLSADAAGQVARKLQFQHRSNRLLWYLEGICQPGNLRRFQAGYRRFNSWVEPAKLRRMSLDQWWGLAKPGSIPERYGALLAMLDQQRVLPRRLRGGETTPIVSPLHSLSLADALDYLYGYVFVGPSSLGSAAPDDSVRAGLRPSRLNERHRGAQAFRFDQVIWGDVEYNVAMIGAAYTRAARMSSPADASWNLSAYELRGMTADAPDRARLALAILTGLALNSDPLQLENWFGRLDLLRQQILHARQRAWDKTRSHMPDSTFSLWAEPPECDRNRFGIDLSAELLSALARLTVSPVMAATRLFSALPNRYRHLTVAGLLHFIEAPGHRRTWLVTADRTVVTLHMNALHMNPLGYESRRYGWYDPLHGLLCFRDGHRLARFLACLFKTDWYASRGFANPDTLVTLSPILHKGIGAFRISESDTRTLSTFINQMPAVAARAWPPGASVTQPGPCATGPASTQSASPATEPASPLCAPPASESAAAQAGRLALASTSPQLAALDLRTPAVKRRHENSLPP